MLGFLMTPAFPLSTGKRNIFAVALLLNLQAHGHGSKWQVTFLKAAFTLGKELIESLASFASLGPNASSRLPRSRMRPENHPAARSPARRKAGSRVGSISLAGLL